MNELTKLEQELIDYIEESAKTDVVKSPIMNGETDMTTTVNDLVNRGYLAIAPDGEITLPADAARGTIVSGRKHGEGWSG